MHPIGRERPLTKLAPIAASRLTLALAHTSSHWHWLTLALAHTGTGSHWHWLTLALAHTGDIHSKDGLRRNGGTDKRLRKPRKLASSKTISAGADALAKICRVCRCTQNPTNQHSARNALCRYRHGKLGANAFLRTAEHSKKAKSPLAIAAEKHSVLYRAVDASISRF